MTTQPSSNQVIQQAMNACHRMIQQTGQVSHGIDWYALFKSLESTTVEPKALPTRVRLTMNVYDHGQDHHPPGYCGRKGDVVEVRSVESLAVAHEGCEGGFIVHRHEFEAVTTEPPRACCEDAPEGMHHPRCLNIGSPVTRAFQPPNTEWRCFHCEEVFTDRDKAAEHFGPHQYTDAACTINAEEFRRMEECCRRHHEEDTDLHRALHAKSAEMQTAVAQAEEKGYDRGLEDAKKHPEELGLTRATVPPSADAKDALFQAWNALHELRIDVHDAEKTAFEALERMK